MTDKTEPAGLRLRLAAAKRLRAVLAGENFSPLATADLADGRDRALANRLITTALRRHGQLNVTIAELLEKGLPPRSGSFEAVLRLSLTQLVFLPDLGAHSALFLAVEATKRDPKSRHLSGLMNAVLRRAQANSARFGMLDDALLLPMPFADTWRQAYGDAALMDFPRALLEGAPLDLTLRDDDPGLAEALGGELVMADTLRLEQRDRPVDALPFYNEGRWWVQDAAAAIPARLMTARAGGRILDLCAAPGGKTAQLVKAGYRVTALDSDAARMARLEQNLDRLGYQAETVIADAIGFTPDRPFDGVLLDAPCSATGTFRRHPEVIWNRTAADVAGRVRLQRALITNAYRCLEAGGILIYCVCSLEPAEGEEQLDWVLKTLPGLEFLPVAQSELPDLAAAVTDRGAVRTHPGLTPGEGAGGMDGFFVARFRRR
ncbi:RsmB/NOP family class I SAM-dependent RNA methyltransferase [Devosia sp.]|uniref:RsmB/NOP family class I SAM-dependent RNA methyltransferase n=1 Tax=Devosia sp. TaxID=1871048 RepID=UPI002AFE0ABA|nr:RsmB/NOP family class I SAM-dependent RNA methyltransferase [Devosia sp.]